MYETIRVGDWLIKADVEETRKQYEKDIKDMCECGNCPNYYEAVNELPVQKDQVLESLGLIPSYSNLYGMQSRLYVSITDEWFYRHTHYPVRSPVTIFQPNHQGLIVSPQPTAV
ncbi:hypothetical protein CM50_01910 [Bacillus subtilis]|nr:hypothetical protein [Bacillus stercoris]KFF55150.1 hypothetical protein CM50_01910 [Bacillus subtilis] [Bacillus stercoris]